MAEKLVANPNLEINNEKISIYGNTMVYDPGHRDVVVSALSAGGGASSTVHGEDVSTAVGMVKFKLPTTDETTRLIAGWKANTAGNVLKFFEGSFEKVMTGASHAEGRELEFNASEGGIEVVFKGDPIEPV